MSITNNLRILSKGMTHSTDWIRTGYGVLRTSNLLKAHSLLIFGFVFSQRAKNFRTSYFPTHVRKVISRTSCFGATISSIFANAHIDTASLGLILIRGPIRIYLILSHRSAERITGRRRWEKSFMVTSLTSKAIRSLESTNLITYF